MSLFRHDVCSMISIFSAALRCLLELFVPTKKIHHFWKNKKIEGRKKKNVLVVRALSSFEKAGQVDGERASVPHSAQCCSPQTTVTIAPPQGFERNFHGDVIMTTPFNSHWLRSHNGRNDRTIASGSPVTHHELPLTSVQCQNWSCAIVVTISRMPIACSCHACVSRFNRTYMWMEKKKCKPLWQSSACMPVP